MDIQPTSTHGHISQEIIDRIEQDEIQSLLRQLNLCKNDIKTLRKIETSQMSKFEKIHYDKKLALSLRKKNILIKKLASLGYKADKRGRPKKSQEETYKSSHVRMTFYSTNDNTRCLRQMKEQGIIENISSFLNNLLEHYFSINRDGNNYEEKN